MPHLRKRVHSDLLSPDLLLSAFDIVILYMPNYRVPFYLQATYDCPIPHPYHGSSPSPCPKHSVSSAADKPHHVIESNQARRNNASANNNPASITHHKLCSLRETTTVTCDQMISEMMFFTSTEPIQDGSSYQRNY